MTAPPGSIPNIRAAACIAEHLGAGCVVEREGRPGECNVSAVSHPEVGSGRLKERMWDELILISATEFTEDTEKSKKALCTLCALWLKN